MWKTLATLFLASVLLFPLPARSESPTKITVNTYGGAYQSFFENEIIPEFNKRYNADVQLAVGLAKDWMAEIRASGPDSAPYDVIMLNEIWSSQVRKEGYVIPLDPAKIPNLEKAMVTFKDANNKINGVIGVIQPAGLVYRTDKVKTIPKSWKDLWSPEYKGQIGLYTITNAMGAMFMLSVGDVFFKDEHNYEKAIDKIAELKPFKTSDFSGDQEKLLSLGEISVGVLDCPAVARLKKVGIPVEFAEPEEFMIMFEQVFTIHKASKVKDLAEKFVNFVLSDEIQQKFMHRFYTTPAMKGVVVPEDLKNLIPIGPDKVNRIALWDWNGFNENKVKIVRMWNQKINR